MIARVREQVRIPVIGNGDLLTADAVPEFFLRTGCSGAMIGRGAFGNPWIFRRALNLLAGKSADEPGIEEIEKTVLRHLRMMVDFRGEAVGVREFRKHLIWYTRGLRGSADFRTLIPLWQTYTEVAERIGEYFSRVKGLPFFSCEQA